MQTNSYKLLSEKTQSQTINIQDDIRFKSFNYYLHSFSPNKVSVIFGNGQAYRGTEYARLVNYLEEGLNFYISDLGYFGFYIKYGILALIAYILLIWRTIKIKASDEQLYCKYFLYFIFLISIIVDAPFNNSYIPSTMIALYILSVNSNNNPIYKNKKESRLLMQE